MFTQTPRPEQTLQRVPSPFSIRSRHNLHTSMQAAAVPGLESTKGSAPGATSGCTEPKLSAVEAAWPIVLIMFLPVSLSPLSININSCSACPLCSYAVNIAGFPPFCEALL